MDYVVCRVCLGALLLTIVSIYLRPAGRVPWAQLEQLLDSLGAHVLILGDFNAHHTAWGSRRIDARGRRLLDIMESRGLCLLNNRTTTYMRSPRCLDALDLSWCSAGVSRHLSCVTDADTRGSDHFPLYISHDRLSGSLAGGVISFMNWSAFREGLRRSVYIGMSPEELSQVVRQSMDSATVRAKPVTGHIGLSLTIDRLRALRHRAEKRACRTGQLSDIMEYRRMKAKVGKELKREDRKRWRGFCQRSRRPSGLRK
ncbi:endonuclease/exonuclease/phosphatase family protein, partial [Bradyrhizobium sp. 33ap4]|uniref:endonuclease/exonuclease/phosphatase family protein n=1 Tax=Bradyrhizobium sp. 33ap4 TaxID=3061630 RepID=UPI003977BC31